jgi:hypothetical protein
MHDELSGGVLHPNVNDGVVSHGSCSPILDFGFWITEKQSFLVHGHSLQYVPIGLAVFEMLPETCTLRLGSIH